MGDEYSDSEKIMRLWIDYENRQKHPQQPQQAQGFFGIPDRMVIWLLIAAQALGVGPDVLQTLIKVVSK